MKQKIKNMIKRIVGFYIDPMIEKLNNELETVKTQMEIRDQVLNKHEHILETCGISTEEGNDFLRKISTAQSGEDCIIAYIIDVLKIEIKDILYLDLGANHAKDLSNTYYFYRKSARGVLVEANPRLIPELKLYRGNDTVLNKCVSDQSGNYVDFYIFNGDGLSTPDYMAAQKFIEENPTLKIVDKVRVETITVNEILEKYFLETPTILNIDIEGKEMDILKSIDFDKYRPLIIICEMIDYSCRLTVGEKNQDILDFMNEKDYLEFAFTGINSIFIDRNNALLK